jgi:hypothetical protein
MLATLLEIPTLTFLGALDLYHGHRRFRRNTLRITEPISIQHHVAYN